MVNVRGTSSTAPSSASAGFPFRCTNVCGGNTTSSSCSNWLNSEISAPMDVLPISMASKVTTPSPPAPPPPPPSLPSCCSLSPATPHTRAASRSMRANALSTATRRLRVALRNGNCTPAAPVSGSEVRAPGRRYARKSLGGMETRASFRSALTSTCTVVVYKVAP